jgi:hypothetical protein
MIGLSGLCAAFMNHSRRCRNVSSEAREVGKEYPIMRRITRLLGNSPGRHEARDFSSMHESMCLSPPQAPEASWRIAHAMPPHWEPELIMTRWNGVSLIKEGVRENLPATDR